MHSPELQIMTAPSHNKQRVVSRKEILMGLELYMVGVMVKDMGKAVEFYRRLGVDIPEGSENQQFVPIKMGEMTFFLNTHELNARWDPAKTEAAGGYRI